MKKYVIISFLLLLPSLMVGQNNMDLGRQYYERLQSKFLTSYEQSSYAKNALTYLQAAAKEGYGEACYYLGNIYREGKIVAQDYKIALNMYKKGLEFGHDVGETEIGDMLRCMLQLASISTDGNTQKTVQDILMTMHTL